MANKHRVSVSPMQNLMKNGEQQQRANVLNMLNLDELCGLTWLPDLVEGVSSLQCIKYASLPSSPVGATSADNLILMVVPCSCRVVVRLHSRTCSR